MKKVFDQTVRDIKREVNKKVLKVPGIEQKVLDATSNEPWGPHGTLLAEVAQATRNYHEYQMIMAVIWKRINDTGKNWRHVYKALTVLEYLVAHGSERVIDDIREHAYQISTLSEFQYIDSSGRDQGTNVRKKSQSLVVLVNDKERIIEVRQKAAANREKFRTTSAGAMYRPGSYSSTGGYGEKYDDDRYGSRDEDRNGSGYGREREYSYKDDDRYGRYGDSNSRDGDRYSRDGYRDDDYRGRSRSSERGYDDDGQTSARGSGAKADDQSQDGRKLERKYSEQNIAPPSYEEAVIGSRSPAERNGEVTAASATESSPPPAPKDASPLAPKAASPSEVHVPSQATDTFGTSASPVVGQAVDEFDPRGSVLAGPTATPAPAISPNNAEMDLLGSLSDSFTANPLAIMPVASEAEVNFSGSTFAATQQAPNDMHQPFGDPFGDSPFKAIPTSGDTMSPQQQTSASMTTFQPNQNTEMPTTAQETVNHFPFGDAFSTGNYSETTFPPTSPNSQFMPQELSTSNEDTDILADILPPSGPSPLGGISAMAGQPVDPAANAFGNYNSQAGTMPPGGPNMIPQAAQFPGGNFLPHGSMVPVSSNMQNLGGPGAQFNNGNMLPQQGSAAPGTPPAGHHIAPGPVPEFNGVNYLQRQGSGGNYLQSQGSGGNYLQSQGSGGNYLQSQGSGQLVSREPTPQFNNAQFTSQHGSNGPAVPQAAQYTAGPSPQFNTGNFLPQQGSSPVFSSTAPQTASATPQFNSGNYMSQHGPAHHSTDGLGNYYSQGTNIPTSSQPSLTSSTGALALVSQPSKDKFETKSTVWADTLSRGLVNLNISGPKTNPLADIGVDFDAINRREKRMEKQPTVAPVSTITMGKAMGSGSGVGRAGAGVIRPSNPMMNSGMGMSAGMNMGGGPGSGMGMGGGPGSGMGMGGGPGSGMGMGGGPGSGMGMGGGPRSGMGMGGGPGSGFGMGGVAGSGMGMGGGPGSGMGMGGGPGTGMGMGGYGGMNQPGGMGMGGMGMGMNMGMGMGMNRPMMGMGMVQGGNMQPPGSAMSGGGYNPMMGGGYAQQPYSGGYR
ncbi:clathrin interactor EPSIN 3-like [Euphorbia lathyris]|uniref:clathrin interactor EPSIN 3-like n=1 Tax=Euphorbia lathyris TaxID=212925 RepID=UPI003313A7B6